MGGVQVGWGRGVGKLEDECSVNGGDAKRLLSKLSPTFSWKHWQKELYKRKPGAYSSPNNLKRVISSFMMSPALYVFVFCGSLYINHWSGKTQKASQFFSSCWSCTSPSWRFPHIQLDITLTVILRLVTCVYSTSHFQLLPSILRRVRFLGRQFVINNHFFGRKLDALTRMATILCILKIQTQVMTLFQITRSLPYTT